MPSTHLSLHYHLVFSTKGREPLIADQWRDRLHAYLGGATRTIDGVAEAIGGTRDHVHLLIRLRATHRLADVLREIKHTSSQWLHETIGVKGFAWQEGYGAFTVSPSKTAAVSRYIARQEEHHRKRTFQEEYLEFLKESGVEYDDRYLW
jgi:REP element-mobilizing transposase RayT